MKINVVCPNIPIYNVQFWNDNDSIMEYNAGWEYTQDFLDFCEPYQSQQKIWINNCYGGAGNIRVYDHDVMMLFKLRFQHD